MSEPKAASTQTALDALRALQADTSELERIENLLDRFNVFESIGFIGREVMHSRFLAFLLEPAQNHGLGTLFLKGFLRKVSESTDKVSLPQTFDSADDGDLNQTTVRTEVYTDDGRIDILLLNEVGEWAMIVENKVWSAEHSDQLDKYHRFVKKTYPGWRVFGVYLTPYGAAPERKEDRETYQPLSYGAVCGIVDGILEGRDSALSADVRMALEHYVQMLRRNIMGDSELARLCSQVYREHRKALDTIYKYRFAQQETIRNKVIELIAATPSLLHDHLNTSYPNEYIGFRLRKYDLPSLRVARGWGGWAKTGYILRFLVVNLPDRLALRLAVGPGDEAARQRLLAMAYANPDVFEAKPAVGQSSEHILYVRHLLAPDFYEDASDTERLQELHRQWDAFLEEDLPRIEAALKAEAWIWESEEPDEGQSSQGSRFVWGEDDIAITKRLGHEA